MKTYLRDFLARNNFSTNREVKQNKHQLVKSWM